MTIGEIQNQARSGDIASESADRVIFVALCLLVFAAGLSTLKTTLFNSMIIAGYEITFVLIYLVLWRAASPRPASNGAGPIVAIAIAAWFVSITVSFFASPYDVAGTWPGIQRYGETLCHVIFFIAVRDFLVRCRPPVYWLLLVIPASGLAVALAAAVLVLNLDVTDKAMGDLWFNNPPFNTHIRHSGYQAAAGVSALTAFFVLDSRVPIAKAPLLAVLVVLWTFLFWMGGRGAILSALVALVLLAIVLRFKGVRSREMWVASFLAVAAGLLLSEWFAVFSWNGVIDLASRTAVAIEANDLNQLGSGRFDLWWTSWISVEEHLVFGLGPQGYWFMPNYIFGVQPHSFLVQFLVEWGLLGGLLFAALLIYGFYRGLEANVFQARGALDMTSLSAGAVLVALTVHGLVDGTYYHPQSSLYLAIGFAVWTLPRRAMGRDG